MKKIKTFFVSLLTIFLGVFSLFSCGGDEGVAGKYIFSYISTTVDGEPVLVNAGDEYNGQIFPKDLITVELKDDGNFLLKMKSFDGEEYSIEGTWEEGEDNSLTLTMEGTSSETALEATIEDGKITLDFFGDGLVTLEKE